jgi:tetratricopeptide (TPR) repeat protein
VRVLGNQFTNWDDDLYVTENLLIQQASLQNLLRVATTLVAFNYHPLTVWSLQLNHALAGLTPWSYFATNVALHLANTVLVFHLLLVLGRVTRVAGMLGAALFAIHPMHVESVAWIAERKDVLCGFFLLAALAAYTRFVRARVLRLRWYLLTLGLTVLAVLSKPAAVVAPMLLLCVDYLERRKLLSRDVLLEKLPFVALAAVFSVITLQVQQEFVALRPLQPLGLPGRLLVASYGLMMYLARFVFPWKLSAFYPYPDLARPWPLEFLVAPAVVVLVAILALRSHRRRRYVAGGLLLFLVALLPVLQLVPVGLAVMADRYSYIPYLGLVLIASRGYDALRGAWRAAPERLFGAEVALGLFILGLGALTWQRVGVWRTSETLWSDVIARYPRVASAYVSRGIARLRAGEFAGAQADLDRAVELAPTSSAGYYNRGLLHQRRNELARAVEDYTQAIARDSTRTEPLVNRAGILVVQGRHAEAVADYDRVLARAPDDSRMLFNRAAARYQAGDYARALVDYERGLKLDPARPEEWFFRGVCEFRLKRLESAISSYDRAITGDPLQGRYFLYRARCLAEMQRRPEAASDARRAMALGVTVEDTFLRSLEAVQ